jgi:hypothetical protein
VPAVLVQLLQRVQAKTKSSQPAGQPASSASCPAHPVGRQELLQVGARLLLCGLRISSSPLSLLPQLCRLPCRVIACDNEQGGMSASLSSIEAWCCARPCSSSRHVGIKCAGEEKHAAGLSCLTSR